MNQQLQNFKADFFKVLAHPMRIRILELLAEGDKSVNQLQELLAVETSSVSQQLAVLRGKSVVESRKENNKIVYTLRDPLIVDLLNVARKIFNNHLITTINMLSNFSTEYGNDQRGR